MKNANFNFRNAKMNLERNLSKETNSKNENNSINVNSITKIEIKSCMSNFNEKMKLKLANERNSRINSLEMEIILKNQSKLYKKGSKNEEFIEFYINDNNKNSIYNLKDNTIYTTKYNLFSFIPKGLLYQFSSWSNIYFLFTAIIQSIPIISPINSITAIIPLIFVLGVSMIREAIEDIGRNNYDNLNNKEEVIVFRNNKFIKSISQTLKHGEIILIYENHNIPADMIVIDSGFKDGTCYVETSSLDGEKNLKLKVANKYTQGFVSDDILIHKDIEKYIQPRKYIFDGFIKINAPNPNLNYINGNIHPRFEKENIVIEQDISITNNEFILKGSVLKNTNWIIGVVAYTGKNNKIILNSKRPRLKISKLERRLNSYLLFVFFLLIFLCVECSITHHLKYKRVYKFYRAVILISKNTMHESIIIFFTYFLLLNTLIPISLIVSIEIIKVIQGIFIQWDVNLYSKWRHCFCTVKGFSINEELGNVNFIFADKTGTLTKNQLRFKYCIIDNKYYKYQRIGQTESIINLLEKFSNRQDSLASCEIVARQNRAKRNSALKENIRYMINKTNNSSNIMIDEVGNDKDNIRKLNNNMYITYQEVIYKKKNKNEEKDNNKIVKNKSLFSIDNNKSSSKKISSINSNNNINKNARIINHDYKSICQNDELKQRENNNTIFEENEFSFYLKGISRIREGYFANPENNSYLKNKYNKNRNSIYYNHEFWIALALANECMIKYENEEIKYIGTSLDDLELVKTASEQGYKLIETSLNKKIIEINGIKYSYEVLQVLGFSSERKRMSIIVRYRNEIILYIKGADSEISKRLSKKTLENENYDVISNGLIEFSKQGLRTLMVAYRKINKEDYNSWMNKLYEDETNIEKKQKLIERLYDIIEKNLTLLGGTVVEDKLQDNVPQTIRELKSAGIKIWILTGDKLDTAESIGYNCNLLSKRQKVFVLKIMNNEEENIELDKSYKELNNFFNDFQEFVNNLVKKYNSESQYMNNNWISNSNRRNYNIEIAQDDKDAKEQSNKSFNFSSINFGLFNYLVDNNILEPFSIIIEAPVLNLLFKDEEMTTDFLKIAYHSNTVICCRISPSQKSQIIQKIKKFDKNAVTLAIGDGSNDVSMITEANIGIGIYGEEGMSAVQASDFAIGEFQLLKRLLFIHGRNNLYRISKMILYFFYKNFIFSFSQFYYSTRCLASGQSIIDDWYVTCYNLIFTSIPLGVRALTDNDINIFDEKVTKNLSALYKENRDNTKIFTFQTLIFDFLKGIFFSYIFYFSGFDNEILIFGYNKNMSYVSLRIYISIIIVVTMNLLIHSHYITYLLLLSVGITTFLLLVIFLVLNHYGLFFNHNSKASLIVPIASSQFILGVLYISCICFVFEYSLKLIKLYFNNSLSSKLFLEESKYNENTNDNDNDNAINNLNQYYPNKKSIISNTPKERVKEDKSNISFLSKKSSYNNKLGLINNKILAIPKSFKFQEYSKNKK